GDGVEDLREPLCVPGDADPPTSLVLRELELVETELVHGGVGRQVEAPPVELGDLGEAQGECGAILAGARAQVLAELRVGEVGERVARHGVPPRKESVAGAIARYSHAWIALPGLAADGVNPRWTGVRIAWRQSARLLDQWPPGYGR